MRTFRSTHFVLRDKTIIITNTKTEPFVRTRPSRSTHRLTLSIQHIHLLLNYTKLKKEIKLYAVYKFIYSKLTCRHIDLRIRSAGERFPKARNRSKRICTSSYLVGLAFCPRRELPILLTLYLDKNHHQHQDRTVRTN